MRAVRRWKRDGTVNYMGLTAACENLKQNSISLTVRKGSLQDIRTRLLRGELLETELSCFSIYTGFHYHD